VVAPWIARLVAVVIVLSAAALAWWHLGVRWSHRRTDLTPAQHEFYRRQFRRRIQVSAMLGFLGVLLATDSWLQQPMVHVVVWAGMLIVLLWIILLALVDAMATRLHFDRLRSDYMVERATLEAEARRLRSVGGNGKPRGKAGQPKDKDAG